MTKTEIIDAAFKVWGRNFYRKTSLSQLACELKVSKPALYRHFESKQALTKAMTERFLDDFSSSIRADFKKAQTQDADEGISTIISSISLFFARDVYAMIFSLINIYDRNLDSREVVQMLKAKDADMSVLQQIIEKKYTGDASITRLMFATLIFFMSHYHKKYKTIENPFSEEQIKNITSIINKTINCGLGFTAQEAAIDFENLEKMVEDTDFEKDVEPFFKAVAEAVAEAGPWDVSMEMVAKKLGLSKSSLYGHFKNKKDMLRRLFMTEFKNIMDYAKLGISKSNVTAAQLYLGIFSIAVYLRSRPEIIIAMDWIRTRRLYLGKPDKHFEIFRLFEDVNIEQLLGADEEEKQRTSHWILFQLINILTNPQGEAEIVQNNSTRLLYKFITMGLGGFIK